MTSETRGWITPEQARQALMEGTGKGVKVAVIDSGIEEGHPDLAAMPLSDSVGFEERDGRIVTIEGAGHDVYGHGTAVAGIVHQTAPEAQIGSFRVIDARSLSRTALICAGVREAMRRGYHVLNCSFGCKGLAKYILPHKAWADEAWLRNIHIIAAAGGIDDNEPEWPSHFTGVMAVGLARTDTDQVYYRTGSMVAYSARGENIEVPWLGGGRQLKTGTSFAAPRVAGQVARLLSLAPGLTPPLVLDLLPRIVEPWDSGLSCQW